MSTIKKLQKQIGLPAVIAISMGTMLGSGLFVLPGLAAVKTGGLVWLAFFIAGICVLPAALSEAELATAMPITGGTYIYLDRTFGPFWGTIVGLGLWLSLLLKSSAALVGFGAYLAILAPVALKPVAICLLGMALLLNIRGIGKVSQFQIVSISISLIFLLSLIILGILSLPSQSPNEILYLDQHNLIAGVAFLFMAYAGVTKVAAIAEEINQPQKNLPLGIIISLALMTLIYTGVSFVLVKILPFSEFSHDMNPIYTFANRLGGQSIGILSALVAILTLTSMANVGLLTASRFPFAMSRDDLFPPQFQKIHKRYVTPHISILYTGALMTLVILFLDIERIAKLASAFIIMIYMAENLTVLVLRETRVQWYKPTYRVPLYPWVQIFGILSGAILLIALGIPSLLAGIVIAVPGIILYFIYGRSRTRRVGVVSQRRIRQELLKSRRFILNRIIPEEFKSKAEIVISLFGPERSPERLVELGAALSPGGKLEVFHLTEIPEQATLDAITKEDPATTGIYRRLTALAEEEKLNLSFETIVTRDVLRTVNEISTHLDCQWLIMEWSGRSRHSITINNPLGWLKDHLNCNLATFYDSGARYFQKILVYVEPGPHDSLVVKTADHLANFYKATLNLVRFVPEKANQTIVQAQADYLDQIKQLCKVPTETLILRGKNEANTIAQSTIDFDLLITSGEPEGNFFSRIFGTSLDRITQLSGCSVLRLLTPRAKIHEAVEIDQSTKDQRDEDLYNFIDSNHVWINLEHTKKEALYEDIAQTFSSVLKNIKSEDILKALWQREKIQNTSVGEGLALPHATLPELEKTYLGIFTTSKPVDYQTPDQEGVDVFFVTLGPPKDRQMHLIILASLSKMVIKTSLLDSLRKAKTKEEVMQAFRNSFEETIH